MVLSLEHELHNNNMPYSTEQELASLQEQLDWYKAGVELMVAQVLAGGRLADNGKCLGAIYERYLAVRHQSALDMAKLLSSHLDMVEALLALSSAAGPQAAETAVANLAARRQRHTAAYSELRGCMASVKT
jgi:hypothetical protein